MSPVQIAGWRNVFVQGSSTSLSKDEREQLRDQAATIKQLEKELNRKESLGRDRGIAGASKKVPGALGGARGRKIDLPARQELIALIEEACANGARLAKACEAVALSPRTVQRWQLPDEVPCDGRKAASRHRKPANKLSEPHRTEIVETANLAKFAKLPPSQIVPKLADEGIYLALESTFHLTLRAEKQLSHRSVPMSGTGYCGFVTKDINPTSSREVADPHVRNINASLPPSLQILPSPPHPHPREDHTGGPPQEL